MFKLKIALYSILIPALVLAGFGIYVYSVIIDVGIKRLDLEIQALGEGQVRMWRPRRDWSEFEKSLKAIYGEDVSGKLIVLVTSADSRTLYKTANWPEGLTAESFAGFDTRMDTETIPRWEREREMARERMREGPGLPPPGMMRGPGRGELGGGPMSPPYPPPRAEVKKPAFKTIAPDGREWRAGAMGSQFVTVVIGVSMDDHRREAAEFRQRFLMTAPLGLLMLAAGGWLIARRAIRPVEKITATAEGITARDLTLRIPGEGADGEIAHLVAVINGMLERLEKSFCQAVRFSADAAHELQTPLTILQGTLDDAIQHSPEGSEEQRRYGELLEEVQRLKSIVQKLLILARADAGKLNLKLVPTDLGAMLRAVIEDIEALAPAMKLEREMADTVIVRADPDMLRQVVQNLAFNAVRHNSGEGRIKIRLTASGTRALLSIANSASPIPKEDRARIFDRFYRADRSRDARAAGTGLGLSIAREIALAHGGSLVLDPPAEGMVSFTLSLPLDGRAKGK